ncbi:MAG: nucleotidyltransferase domain-containing protein [Candidatus Cloacimonetes bacterium]|nr:nucleotidyltransferase domain-containing protein [Candidatus Cloacimonadota bacterium]
MKVKHISSSWLKSAVKKILKKHLDLSSYEAFFFGSRVRGDNFERADIDIGVVGPRPIPAEKKLVIAEELERLPILYKFDFVDFKSVSPSFYKEALKYKETI